MTVSMTMQETLATIQRNQQQIDLLTANNTQLVHFLLSQGVIQSLSDLPGFNPHSAAVPALQVPMRPLLAPPPTRSEGRGRKQATRETTPQSNAGRGKVQADLLVTWARQAGGTLKLAEFRAAQKGNVPEVNASFYSTTMYTKVGELTAQGIFTKIRPGEYRLNER